MLEVKVTGDFKQRNKKKNTTFVKYVKKVEKMNKFAFVQTKRIFVKDFVKWIEPVVLVRLLTQEITEITQQ